MLVYGSNFFLIFLRNTVGIGHISSSVPITWFPAGRNIFPDLRCNYAVDQSFGKLNLTSTSIVTGMGTPFR